MSSLVGHGLALVIIRRGATRERGVKNDDTIIRGIAGVVAWESGIAKKALARAGLETDSVDVESIDATLSQLALHGCLRTAVWPNRCEPIGVGGVISASE